MAGIIWIIQDIVAITNNIEAHIEALRSKLRRIFNT